MYHEQTNKDDVKEDFCGACLLAPLAMSGAAAGVIAGGESKKKRDAKNKRNMFIGVALTIAGILMYMMYTNGCTSCNKVCGKPSTKSK